jgi:hypothetical protein
MPRLAWILAAVLMLTLLPTPVAAAERCTIDVTPDQGSPTDVYRISVSDIPVDPNGGSVEVRIDVRRLGSREGSIFFVFLVPGVTDFFLDYNAAFPEEPPPDPLAEGRYLVSAQTPHVRGCHSTDRFVVVA